MPRVCFEWEGTYCSFSSSLSLSLISYIGGDPFTPSLFTHTCTHVHTHPSIHEHHGLPCPAALATPVRAEAGAPLRHSPGMPGRTERPGSMTAVPSTGKGRRDGRHFCKGQLRLAGRCGGPESARGPRWAVVLAPHGVGGANLSSLEQVSVVMPLPGVTPGIWPLKLTQRERHLPQTTTEQALQPLGRRGGLCCSPTHNTRRSGPLSGLHFPLLPEALSSH